MSVLNPIVTPEFRARVANLRVPGGVVGIPKEWAPSLTRAKSAWLDFAAETTSRETTFPYVMETRLRSKDRQENRKSERFFAKGWLDRVPCPISAFSTTISEDESQANSLPAAIDSRQRVLRSLPQLLRLATPHNQQK